MIEHGLGEHGSSIPRVRESGNDKDVEVTATVVVAAVIERGDRRILIGQRRRDDTSPLKWEFPGGKVRQDEAPEEALARELQEELGATLMGCVEIGRVQHAYSSAAGQLEIRFYAAEIADATIEPKCFEQIAWALPKELGEYDFLDANRGLVAQIATGKVKPAEILRNAKLRE
jgi:8-oxo-dGTP diphosphatase